MLGDTFCHSWQPRSTHFTTLDRATGHISVIPQRRRTHFYNTWPHVVWHVACVITRDMRPHVYGKKKTWDKWLYGHMPPQVATRLWCADMSCWCVVTNVLLSFFSHIYKQSIFHNNESFIINKYFCYLTICHTLCLNMSLLSSSLSKPHCWVIQ